MSAVNYCIGNLARNVDTVSCNIREFSIAILDGLKNGRAAGGRSPKQYDPHSIPSLPTNMVMIQCFYCKHGWHSKAGVWEGGGGAGAAPPFANKMISITFPYCQHGNDMMFIFTARIGGRSTPTCKPNYPDNLPLLQTW